MSKFIGTGPSSSEKKNLPGRGLTKVEKHCLKSSNAFGYDEVPAKILKLCSHFFNSPLIMYVTGLFLLEFFPIG